MNKGMGWGGALFMVLVLLWPHWKLKRYFYWMWGSGQCSSHRLSSIDLSSHTSVLVDSEDCTVGAWVHTSVSFQTRQESTPVLPSFLPTPPTHCLGGNPMGIPSWGCSTLCSAPQMPQRGAPALPSGTQTLKHEVEKTCLSLSSALQGSSSGEDGPVGSRSL